MTTRSQFFFYCIATLVLILLLSLVWPGVLWLLTVIVPVIGLGSYDLLQRKHTLLRIYPVFAHLRYLFESVRPEIQQYFVESDTNGIPVSREFRSLVYQRAKGVRDTRPFGTLFDTYRDGYEWINHSLAPKPVAKDQPCIRFGQGDKAYTASPLNISAMSFGALSCHAIMALNKGAKIGGFAHNTGEGGLSPYHRRYGGDLIWQIGTGYFGCRTCDGGFDTELFANNATTDTVKMIEIKLSQGAKPGHGGILPAVKLTPEIAEIRHVSLGQDVVSPPAHSAFSTPTGLLQFVAQLRQLSGGKPVGVKLCIGNKSEFLAICKAMLETGIHVDFVTVDGAEGGTGAAPIEFTNSVGTPLREGLVFVDNALRGVGLRDRVRVIASGKVFSAFHMLRLLALGADTINVARAMMFALGCIQSRHCNQDTCPTGIATQDPLRYRWLDIDDKAQRVATYHASMIENLMELIAAVGLERPEQLAPHHIQRRISGSKISDYSQLYPILKNGSLLQESTVPAGWIQDWSQAQAASW